MLRRGNLGVSRTHQATDIAELRYDVLSLLELIACIGCAVSKAKTYAWLLAIRTLACCHCHSDGFCLKGQFVAKIRRFVKIWVGDCEKCY